MLYYDEKLQALQKEMAEQPRRTRDQIHSILSDLFLMDQAAAEQQETLTQTLNELVLRASV